jgi:tetratricopeptide (TPR) repeat protein
MTARARRWLFGPLPDLLFGCGLLYAGFFAAQVFAGERMRAIFPLEYQPFLALALGTPHYGATLLRVYERREDRRRYAVFAVWITLALAVAFVVGLRVFAIGSLIVTIYMTWSPWHYSGQNYGIALMFLRRRNVDVPPAVQRLLQASFVLSFLLVTLLSHGVAPGEAYAPGTAAGTAYSFIPIGIPYAGVLFDACAAAYAVVVLACAAALLRRASPGDLAPAAALVAVQALWFAAPACARHFGVGAALDPFQRGAYTFLWVSMGHFVQYLWITAYYAAAAHPATGAAEDRALQHGRFLAKALLAGVAIWVGPKLLFAPGALGSLPEDFGLGILVAAIVNIHHFVLDGAIWKLRSGPIARVLLREEPPEPAVAVSPPGWIHRGAIAAAAVAAALVLVAAVVANVDDIAVRRAAQRGDLERTLAGVERLRWLGRPSPEHHVLLARLYSERGDAPGVRRELDRSLRVYPTARAWRLLGVLDEREGRFEAALGDHGAALALVPDFVPSLVGTARAMIGLGRRDEAAAWLDRAARIAPKDAEVVAALGTTRTNSAANPSPAAQ